MTRTLQLLGALLLAACCGCDDEPSAGPACDQGEWNSGVESGQYAILCSQEHVDAREGNTAFIGANAFVIGFATEEDYLALTCPPGGGNHITSLASLECLQSVNGALAISYLDHLQSLDGLDNLLYLEEGHFGWDLKITDNAQLPTCEAEALVAQLQSAGWAGTAIIENNNDAATCD